MDSLLDLMQQHEHWHHHIEAILEGQDEIHRLDNVHRLLVHFDDIQQQIIYIVHENVFVLVLLIYLDKNKKKRGEIDIQLGTLPL